MYAWYVTYRWYDTDTYCANICYAENDTDVYRHYGMHNYVHVRKADDAEIMAAKYKGMPIIKIEK
jgi:hypothetical protein